MKSALVIGASRGIGRQIALTLSENGYKVGVAAKTVESTPKLPGSIYTVCDEIKEKGGIAIPIVCNVRKEAEIENAVQTCIKEFGDLDYAVYNAGAIMWEKVIDTPLKRFDLLHEVNLRGSYCLIQSILPYFLKKNKGRICLASPPIYNRFFRGKTPYAATKVGMTVLVHGLGMELKNTGVSISGLWPATSVDSFVMEYYNYPKQIYRLSTIMADATLTIGEEPTQKYNGKALIDEDLLRSTGVADFTKYRADPDHEPPRMMPKEFPSLLVAEEDIDPLAKPKL